MRTKEPKQYKPDYAEISRRSIKRDFQNASFRNQGKRPRIKVERPIEQAEPQQDIKRVLGLSETSGYAKYKRFFIGKLVRILYPAKTGGYYVEFVRDSDRKTLNANAGWTDKTIYLLDGAKFD